MTENNVYIHIQNSLKKIVFQYILCIIPLVFYGIYKNGFLLWNRDLISFLDIFKLIYLLLISIGIYFLVYKIIFKRKCIFTLELIYYFIIPLFMPPNINILLYTIALFISSILCLFLEKFCRFNKIAFCKLFIALCTLIFSNYTYLNIAEQMNIYHLNYWDLLWGRNIGGIATTNIIFGIIILIILVLLKNYKKIIALTSLITFSVLILIFNNFDPFALISSSAILGLILLNVDSTSTPRHRKSMYIYGIALGILSFLLTNYLNPFEGVFISSLFLSFFSPILDKMFEK